MGEVRRIGPEDRVEADPTPGMTREQAVASDALWAGYVRTAPGMVSGWHHHGGHETAVYVLSGVFRVEFGPDGSRATQGRAGDFVVVPPYTVHRESNPADEESALVVVRAGSGPPTVNVEGPDER